jgi:hypothetical protein
MNEYDDFDEPCVFLILSNSEITLVDADTYHDLAQFKWSRSSSGYAHRKIARQKAWESLHVRVNKTPKGMDTDHRNTFKMDNRRSNLRSCSRAQNEANKPKRSNSTSRFKGVCWNAQANNWKARICVNGQCRNLGHFKTESEAAGAYRTACREVFGEYGRTSL